MAQHVYSVSQAINAGGNFCTNTFHYQFDDSGFSSTATAALALITAYKAAIQTALKNALPTACTVLSYKGRAVNQPGGFESLLTAGVAQAGARTGNLQAAGIGPVTIFYPTGNAKQRGRMFLSGITATDCVDGIMTVAYRTVLATLNTLLVTPLTLVGGGAPVATPGVYSRPPSNIFRPIGVAQISDVLGQVRRRQVPIP